MLFQRKVARKVRIIDISQGKWVEKDEAEGTGGYVETAFGEVSRARLVGIIVAKFISDDKMFGSVTLDDSTDTIRLKCFKDLALLQTAEIGQTVEVTGKTKMYNDEVYIIPEIISKVSPNFELLRRLELLKYNKNPVKTDKQQPTQVNVEGSTKQFTNQHLTKPSTADPRKYILKIIEGEKDPIGYGELIKKSGMTEEAVEKVIDELLSGGICYEPSPGKIKKI